MTRQSDGSYMPNFKVRYLTQDIPYGLLYNRGVAELAGVKTPNIDEVIEFSQKKIGKTYLVRMYVYINLTQILHLHVINFQ